MEREFPIIEIVPDKTEEETSEKIKMTGNILEVIFFIFLSMFPTRFLVYSY